MNCRVINASRYSCNIELDVLVIGFLAKSGDYVLFHKILDEAGRNNPFDFEINDQQCVSDNVRSFVLDRSRIQISLVRPLNGASEIVIEISDLQDEYQNIVDQFQLIFRGNENLLTALSMAS